ncbi:MAG: EAL domain-containing protein, partial [Zoogloeaceae bacterium]|nr:EAL domain-containing protein [Zoogloeaceae bacterium]
IVRHSIELAHDLGIATVAECIESSDQAELLRAMGCDFGQGFHFSRPLSPERVEEIMFGKEISMRVLP